MNFDQHLPPPSERRGRFEKLRPTGYALTSFLKPFYKLKQSKNPNAVFLWIPRTGGTSFYNALATKGCPKLRRLEQIQYRFTQSGLITFSHVDYLALLSAGFVKPEFDQHSYKFAIVRNPYDRLVSLFHYFIKHRDLHSKTPFSLFCQFLKNGAIDQIGLFNVNGMSQCQPQVRWLKDGDGKIIADDIGKYETLADSFDMIMGKLGLQAELPHVNSTVHKPYLEYYTPELLKIVGDYYAEDLETFDYPWL